MTDTDPLPYSPNPVPGRSENTQAARTLHRWQFRDAKLPGFTAANPRPRSLGEDRILLPNVEPGNAPPRRYRAN